MNNNIVDISGLNKCYIKGENILNDLNYKLNYGEFSIIRGNSGCGKSTLLNIIGFLDGFDDGKYCFMGHNISYHNSRKCFELRNEHIGFVFQSYNLIESLTVKENIYLPLLYSQKNISRKTQEEIFSLAERFGISQFFNKLARDLSGGEKQRVAIARAIVKSPELVIADEPTGNLDSVNTKIVLEFLKSYVSQNRSVIVVTHDDRILEYGDSKYILKCGKLVKC